MDLSELSVYELAGVGVLALITIASVIVKLTKTQRDDIWLSRWLVRLSALWPWGGLKLPIIQGQKPPENRE